jgi:carboxyl-terminal processing protease
MMQREQDLSKLDERDCPVKTHEKDFKCKQCGKTFHKPVVVLVGNMTFSAAEDFVVAFDLMKRGKLIGEPTGGSTGQPYSFKLPGGLSARVCMKRDTYPDGKEFVGVGVQPDILVVPTIADIRDGRDVALSKAIEFLTRAQQR